MYFIEYKDLTFKFITIFNRSFAYCMKNVQEQMVMNSCITQLTSEKPQSCFLLNKETTTEKNYLCLFIL